MEAEDGVGVALGENVEELEDNDDLVALDGVLVEEGLGEPLVEALDVALRDSAVVCIAEEEEDEESAGTI